MNVRIFLLLATLFVAADARAQGENAALKERVLLLPAPQMEAATLEALYGGLAAAGLAVVDRADRAGVDLPPTPERFTASDPDAVKDALLTAKARFREFDFEGARAALDAGEQAFLRLSQPELFTELYAELLLSRANLSLAENDADGAADALTLLAHLQPDKESLHAGLYPPNLVAAYEAARAESAKSDKGYLVVVPRGAQAQILVDNHASAAAGESLPLSAGPHLVSVRAPGRATLTWRIEVVGNLSILSEPFVPESGADVQRQAALTSLRDGDEDAKRASAAELLRLAGATALVDLAGPLVFTVERGFTPLEVDVTGSPLEFGRAVNTALENPSSVSTATKDPSVVTNASDATTDEADAPLWPWVVGGTAVTGVVVAAVASAVGITVWVLTSLNPVDPEPRSVDITCCGRS